MNYTVPPNEHLLDRELFQFFLNGLPQNLCYTAPISGSLNLEDLAVKLDNYIFISKF